MDRRSGRSGFGGTCAGACRPSICARASRHGYPHAFPFDPDRRPAPRHRRLRRRAGHGTGRREYCRATLQRARPRGCARHDHRVHGPAVPVLCALCDPDVSGAATALHRHRDGALRLARPAVAQPRIRSARQPWPRAARASKAGSGNSGRRCSRRRRTLGPGTYADLARKFDLDPEAFAACRSDGRQAANVRADLELARANGITATPSLVIGRLVDGQFQGETIEGAKPYAVIAARIEALLEAAR